MRKVLFLMFLLLLMGLGAASVKAQVRIGGNGAPNAGAVLDLNATDATTGTKGLALPRVNLTSATMQLTTGVANLTGMLVYNTTATLGAIGIYYWNGSSWVLASLPATSTVDSGKSLISTGKGWVVAEDTLKIVNTLTGAKWLNSVAPVSMYEFLDTAVTGPTSVHTRSVIYFADQPDPRLIARFCLTDHMGVTALLGGGIIYLDPIPGIPITFPTGLIHARCFGIDR